MSGSIVGDDLMRNVLLRKLPGCQHGALLTRPGLVAKHMKFPAYRLGGIHRGRGRADIHKGEPASIAMGQNPYAIADQPGAMLPDCTAMLHVLVGKFFGCG